MSHYEPARGDENIADVSPVEPYDTPEAVRAMVISYFEWLSAREPVSPGDRFTKFATKVGIPKVRPEWRVALRSVFESRKSFQDKPPRCRPWWCISCSRQIDRSEP